MGLTYVNQGNSNAPLSVLALRTLITHFQGEDSDGQYASGILIDSTYVLTARHPFEAPGQTYLRAEVQPFGTSKTTTTNQAVELVGDYTGGGGIEDVADDIGLLTLPSPVTSINPALYAGLGAFADPTRLSGLSVISYGNKAEGTSTPRFVKTDGVIGLASNGMFGPVVGMQQYGGQSGAGVIAFTPQGEAFILGVANSHLASTYNSLGAYLTPEDLTFIMNILEAANPNADPNVMPRNFLFGSNSQGVALTGSYRRDMIDGGSANETLSGGKADDEIHGRGGNDQLAGDEGNDTLLGGSGNDTISGGSGNDVVIFRKGEGSDSIADNGGTADRLVLDVDPQDVTVEIVGSDVVLRIATRGQATETLTLSGSAGVGDTGIDLIQFANGTVWTRSQFLPASGQTEIGTAGADTVVGSSGDDLITGEGGNDLLVGGEGADEYAFAAGDGTDTIREGFSSAVQDRLVLGTGLTTSNLTLSAGPGEGDLILDFGASGSIVLEGQLIDGGAGAGVEEIEFGNSVVWTKTDLTANWIAASQTSGADTISGGGGDDTLAGLAGDDHLVGRDGGDTYLFSSGDGADTIAEAEDGSGVDRLVLGSGLVPAGLTLVRSALAPNDVKLDFGSAGSVTIANQFGPGGSGIEELEFGDSAVWSEADLLSVYLQAAQTSGADTVWASAGDDTLAGLAGDDRLSGGLGSDTYVFNSGDGNDLILEDQDLAGEDRLVLGSGLIPSNLTVLRGANPDDVILDFGSGNIIRLEGQLAGSGRGVEEIEFGDTTVWTRDDLAAAALAASQSSGDDTIIGTGGDDTLAGGDGDDQLEGGAGSDTYLINPSEGNDRIVEDNNPNEIDILVLADGLYSWDFIVVRSETNPDDISLVFGTGEVIELPGQFAHYGPGAGIELFQFFEEDPYTKEQIQQLYLDQLATENDDEIIGFQGADWLYGGDGNDTLLGLGAPDVLEGGWGDDVLAGGAGDDLYFIGRGQGADVIIEADGEGSADRLELFDIGPNDVVLSQNGKVITLTVAETEPGWGNGLEVAFEIDLEDGATEGIDEIAFDGGVVWTRADIRDWFGVVGTSGDDTIDGTSWGNNISGAAGNDLISGLEGADTLNGDDGDDTVAGGTGDDNLAGGADNDALYGGEIGQDGSGADTFNGGAGNDTIQGGSGANHYVFEAGHGQDLIREGGSLQSSVIDIVSFGAGILPADIVVSRDGLDVLLSHTNGVDSVRLEGFFAASDLRYAIERIEFDGGTLWTRDDLTFWAAQIGTAGADTLFGSIGPDSISGEDGDDQLNGASGNDALSGGSGADTLDGVAGDDTLEGGDGNDRLLGSSGNDVLRGDGGADSLSGGDQDDLLEGDDGNDTLNGGNGADTLLGGADNDTLAGAAGNDLLDGGDGTDTLHGGSGADTFVGGAGNDVFRFDVISDMGGDVVSDFTGGSDVIDLSAIDAKTTVSGNQAFTWIGAGAFSSTAGELRYASVGSDVVVSGDVNGDGVPDFAITLVGVGSLQAADFVL